MAILTDKTSVTIDGKNVIGSASAGWSLRSGVHPVTERFDVSPSDAIAIADKKGPLDLIITPPEGSPLKVTNLWCLNILPGPNPYISTIILADRRWFWNYGHVVRRYNMRRNTGVKRLYANDKFVDEFQRAPQVAYWRWSLNGQAPWQPEQAVLDVFRCVSEVEKSFHGSGFQVKFDDRIGSKIDGLPVEEVTIDDAGDVAIQRILAYLPEADVNVDYDGTVIIYSRAGGDEEEIVKAILPEIRNRGHSDLVSNRLLRPKEIHFLFTREVEVRHNFIENASAVGQTVTADGPLGDARQMENVLPIPDYQLSVSSLGLLPQGCYITFDQAFISWGNIPLNGTNRQMDHNIVQRAFIPEMDLWSALQAAGDRPLKASQIADWVSRIGACQGHYRQTFRLNSRWMDRSLGIKAYRVTVTDPQSGQRAPSYAYGDYAIRYTQRSIWRNRGQGKPLDWVINKDAYPASGNLDDTAEPSMAIVRVVDSDQGIIHVEYRVDPLKQYEMILPSQVKLDSMPTADITQTTRPITFDSVLNALNPPRLSPSFKLATVITHVPASPNNNQQLHRIKVTPQAVAPLLPQKAQAGLSQAEGPIMEIRIGSNVEVARIQWLDSQSDTIETIFGLKEIPNTPQAQEAFSLKVSRLCTNQNSSSVAVGNTKASLQAIALARAASIYASLVDRYQERSTGYMNPNVHLNGWTNEIRHEVDSQGVATTEISFPPEVPQLNMMAFLDSNTRSAILKLVQPL